MREVSRGPSGERWARGLLTTAVYVVGLLYLAATYYISDSVRFIVDLWVGSVRFTAADFPPGDISPGDKLGYGIAAFVAQVALAGVLFAATFTLTQKIKRTKIPAVAAGVLALVYIVCGSVQFTMSLMTDP